MLKAALVLEVTCTAACLASGEILSEGFSPPVKYRVPFQQKYVPMNV